jgi:hypothetical protein
VVLELDRDMALVDGAARMAHWSARGLFLVVIAAVRWYRGLDDVHIVRSCAFGGASECVAANLVVLFFQVPLRIQLLYQHFRARGVPKTCCSSHQDIHV